MMDSPRDDMQSLPEGNEALRALVLTMMSEHEATLAERDALALERDILQTQNDRLRHLLLQLRRLHFGSRSERRSILANSDDYQLLTFGRFMVTVSMTAYGRELPVDPLIGFLRQKRGAAGALAMIFLRVWCIPERHDGIADELIDGAAL